MSGFSDMIDGLATALANGVAGLRVYKYPVNGVNEFPAAVILPEDFDPRVAFGGNTIDATFRVVLLLAKEGDVEAGYQALWDHIDPTTATASVIKAIKDDPDLNGKVDTSDVVSIENIGRRELSGQFYIGADFLVQAVKSVA